MERESLEMDVVFVGAGPANLSGALHLARLIADHNEKNENVLGEIQIAGIDKEGKQKDNYEPGVDLLAKVTVLGEGVRGSLTKKLIQRLGLDEGREPQVYSLGVKELWELPDDRYPAGRVTHTLGFPSDQWTYGGGWIYGMQNRVVNLGYVTVLDYRDPLIDPHAEFQKFKTHPFASKLWSGGKMIRYGAKAIAAGGLHAMPR